VCNFVRNLKFFNQKTKIAMKSNLHLCLAILIIFPWVAHAQFWPTETLRSNILGAWSRVGDFDLDGDPDILVQAGDSIYWYENLRPGWTPHLIDPTFYNSKYGYVDVLDMDGDGDLDVLKAPASAGIDSLSWNENISNGSEWVKHNLIKVNGDLAWMAQSFGDLDGDGDIDLVVPEYDFENTPSSANLYWLENEGNTGSWKIHVLKAGNHWYSSLADMDGDGDLDVVASWEGLFWLENELPDTTWTLHPIFDAGISSHFIGDCHDLNGDGNADILSAPSHLTGGLVYYSNPDWQEMTVHPAQQLIPGIIGDIDGDGDPDITYGGAGNVSQALGWAENQNNGANWVLHNITPAQTIQRIPTGLADIDGDGDLDIISLTFNVNTGLGSVVWHANPMIVTGVDGQSLSSARLSLNAWPNPFSATLTAEFELQGSGEVQLAVYNLLGQPVRLLAGGRQEAGTHTSTWDGKMDNGLPAPAGMYLLRLETERGTVVETVIFEGR
jgi:hypothetical protein